MWFWVFMQQHTSMRKDWELLHTSSTSHKNILDSDIRERKLHSEAASKRNIKTQTVFIVYIRQGMGLAWWNQKSLQYFKFSFCSKNPTSKRGSECTGERVSGWVSDRLISYIFSAYGDTTISNVVKKAGISVWFAYYNFFWKNRVVKIALKLIFKS